MRRTAALLALASSCAVGAACGTAEPVAEMIAVEGCITASGDQFVLTDLSPAAPDPSLEHQAVDTSPVPTTEAYLLAGSDQELRDAVGGRVRVRGEADPAHVAEIRQMTPMVRATEGGFGTGTPIQPVEPPEATSGTDPAAAERAEPIVTAERHLRFEIHRLQVATVTPTGERCQLATAIP